MVDVKEHSRRHAAGEWGVQIDVENTAGGGYLATVAVPTSKSDYNIFYLRAPSQALIMELIRPFLRILK